MRYVTGTTAFEPREILDTLDDGRFLIISRYREGPENGYIVKGEFAPELFQQRVKLRVPSGPLTAHSVSDFLVWVFDTYDPSEVYAYCYAYEAKDGRIIHQHST
jgi:hypothetical protein